jgi:hypothetical protein
MSKGVSETRNFCSSNPDVRACVKISVLSRNRQVDSQRLKANQSKHCLECLVIEYV